MTQNKKSQQHTFVKDSDDLVELKKAPEAPEARQLKSIVTIRYFEPGQVPGTDEPTEQIAYHVDRATGLRRFKEG